MPFDIWFCVYHLLLECVKSYQEFCFSSFLTWTLEQEIYCFILLSASVACVAVAPYFPFGGCWEPSGENHGCECLFLGKEASARCSVSLPVNVMQNCWRQLKASPIIFSNVEVAPFLSEIPGLFVFVRRSAGIQLGTTALQSSVVVLY